MNFSSNAHVGKNRAVRETVASVVAVLLILAVPAAAGAQGADQYQPSPPPSAGGGGGATGSGAGGAFGGGAAGGAGGDAAGGAGGGGFGVAPDGSISSGASPAPITPSGDVVGGELGSSGGGAGGNGNGNGNGDDANLASASPLGVAANRPPAALGAQASSGGIGTVPILIVLAVLLTAVVVLAARGASRSRAET